MSTTTGHLIRTKGLTSGEIAAHLADLRHGDDSGDHLHDHRQS